MINRLLPLLLALFSTGVAAEPDLDDPATRKAIVVEAATEEEARRAGKAYSGWVKALNGDGSLRELYETRGGTKNGRTVSWRRDGRKAWEGHYKDGNQFGEWTYFGPDGKKITRVFTEEDIAIRARLKAARAKGGPKRSPHLVAMFDADGNGVLDNDEKRELSESDARRAALARAHRLEELDADGDGQVSAREQFAPWDADGDGQLSAAEREVMVAKKKKAHAEKMAADLKRYDRDGDEQVTPEERIAAYDKDGDGKLDALERADMRRDFEQGLLFGR